MPELPEVETVAQGLRRRALGRRIAAVEIRHAGVIGGSAEEFVSTLEGRKLAKVSRKGKAIAVELAADDGSAPRFLLVRLGMTGQLTVTPHDAPIEPHTHVFMALDDGREELRFRDARRFGRLRSLTQTELEKVLGALGPDAQKRDGAAIPCRHARPQRRHQELADEPESGGGLGKHLRR